MSHRESPEPEATPDAGDESADWPRTHWSWVDGAGSGDPAVRRHALERLAQAYRQPVIRAIMRQGVPAGEAEDLCHDFLSVNLLSENGEGLTFFAQAHPDRGRLRDLIFVSLKRFLVSRYRFRSADRRGGGAFHDSLDREGGFEPAGPDAADRDLIGFDRDWAVSLFQQAYATLADEFTAEGKGALYAAIQPYLLGGESLPRQQDIADELGMKTGALRVALGRARNRFRRQLRAAISRTVTRPEEIEDELRHLCRVLGGM